MNDHKREIHIHRYKNRWTEMQTEAVFQHALDLTQAWSALSEGGHLALDFHPPGANAESGQ